MQAVTLAVLADGGKWRFKDLHNAIESPSGRVPSAGNLCTILRSLQNLGYSEVEGENRVSNRHFITDAGRAALAEFEAANAQG